MIVSISNPYLSDDRGRQIFTVTGQKARNESIIRLTVNELPEDKTHEDVVRAYSGFGSEQLTTLAQKTASRAVIPVGLRFDKSWAAIGPAGEFHTLQYRSPKGVEVGSLEDLLAML